ncbi:antibiotic biosynthesis monooxygenase [Pseudorhizobium endolithicum]|uniref:Antibiotic biosynthesis monooxygenase n=1 Tax=Pseudorhizobium endolithicum TaxID=1191678 RepID=A0ABM8PDB0_9HYPH|nr:putative quinol monooxygenase [Pseudorhizobium endolithicum]CAD7023586.1 antibiotic biosynthesis monooxygenase [Pseudorhizobium endolithicum]
MSVTYLIEFDVKPAERERFLRLLSGVLDAMRHEAMFVEATLHADPETDTRFLLHETWRSHEDVLSVQLARPYRQEWHAALPDLLAAERKISVWQPLRSDRTVTAA